MLSWHLGAEQGAGKDPFTQRSKKDELGVAGGFQDNYIAHRAGTRMKGSYKRRLLCSLETARSLTYLRSQQEGSEKRERDHSVSWRGNTAS